MTPSNNIENEHTFILLFLFLIKIRKELSTLYGEHHDTTIELQIQQTQNRHGQMTKDKEAIVGGALSQLNALVSV